VCVLQGFSTQHGADVLMCAPCGVKYRKTETVSLLQKSSRVTIIDSEHHNCPILGPSGRIGYKAMWLIVVFFLILLSILGVSTYRSGIVGLSSSHHNQSSINLLFQLDRPCVATWTYTSRHAGRDSGKELASTHLISMPKVA